MSKTPNYDAKVKKILDSLQPGERVCALTGEKWFMDEEEIEWYKKFNVPPSKYSPLTRMKIYTGFYSGYQWWWNTDAKRGKKILTCVHPATKLKVMSDADWFNEDFIEHLSVSISDLFFERFRVLQFQIPVLATYNLKEPENSLALVSNGDVNSYFVLACTSRDAFYSTNVTGERFMECDGSLDVSDSFRVAVSKKIQNSKYILACENIVGSTFLFDCRDVSDSFFAWNQRHKKYLWFNEQLTREEYFKRLASVDLSSQSELNKYEEKFKEIVEHEVVWPENFNVSVVNSEGDYLSNVINCHGCYNCWNSAHDLYWVIHGYNGSGFAAFVAGTYGSSDVYSSCTVADSSDIKFGFHIVRSQGLEYCMQCFDCENCFGCIGLKRKKYHIFNQSFTEKEYWLEVDKIKSKMLETGEYGEYFPLSFSQSYLPQSGSALYFNVNDNEQFKLGGVIFDPESLGAIGNLAQSEPIFASSLPDRIDNNTDKLVGIPILDEKTNRKFALLKTELDFYRRFKLPLPTEHFIFRLKTIIKWSNSGVFEELVCAKCLCSITVAKNSFFQDRKIYCRSCYFKYLEENN